MTYLRYDRAQIKATLTDEGYLVDAPVVGRVGIQVYMNADGTKRRELRLPEEVFSADALASFAGKPITDEHPAEAVNASNAKALSVGVIKSDGQADGDNVTAQIVIHDAAVIDKIINGKKRELSLGYMVKLDETPGVWNGQPYDAIQRDIRVNHLAIVPKGRAGNARLNIDRQDAVSFNDDEDQSMTDNLARIRLDSGLEYQAAPEVVVAVEKLRADNAELTTRADEARKAIDVLTAERDTLKAQVADADKVRADALDNARAELKARAALDKVAAEFKVDGEGKTDREVKEMVIKAVRADADLTNKSDDYIDAAFDLSVALKADAAIAAQRVAGTIVNDSKPEATGYKAYMNSLGKQGQK